MDVKKTTVAVMMRDINSDFSEAMYSGLYDAAREEDVNLVYLLGPQSPGEDRIIEDNDMDNEYVDQLDSVYDYVNILKPDVLIIVSGSLKRSRILPDINALVERYKEVPMLVLETRPVKPSIAYQVAESYQAMCECVEHLITEHNSNFIVYVSGNPAEYDFKERLRAFKDTMNAHSLDFSDDQIVVCDQSDSDERRISAIFDEFPYVDAIVCSCDIYARMVYRACNKRGIKVGKEVAVTGFDDVGMSHAMTPELTGVMYDSYNFGYEALRRALRVAAGERIGGFKIPCHFKRRMSCGCIDKKAPRKQEEGPAPVNEVVRAHIKKLISSSVDKDVDVIYSILPYETEKHSFKSYYSEMFNYLYDSIFTEWEDIDEVYVNMKRYVYILAGFKDISFRMVAEQCIQTMENVMDMVPYGRERAKLTSIVIESIKYVKEAEIVRMRERGIMRRGHLWFIPLFTKDLLDESKTEVDVLMTIMKRLKGMKVKSAHFFIYNKPVVYRRDQMPPAPEQLNYAAYFDGDDRNVYLRQNGVGIDTYNGISSVLPRGESHRFVSFAICSGNRQYGIVLYEVEREDIFFVMMCTLQIGALFNFRDLRYIAEENIQKVKIMEDVLGYVSMKDDLTGVLNGNGFMDKFVPLVNNNGGSKGYLLFIDVAHMHEINSVFGHEAGDSALKCVADRLAMILGEENIPARMGDDEFISVILTDNYDMINSIQASINRGMEDFNHDSDLQFEVEIRMGTYPFICETGMDASGLLNRAAQAMEKELETGGKLKIKKK